MVNNCIGIRNMRTFVSFILSSYILAILSLLRVLSVSIEAIQIEVVTITAAKVIIILLLLLVSVPTYCFMMHDDA